MEYHFSQETASIHQERDLGQHTLIIMNDNSIHLLANDGHIPSLADDGMSLDSEETYHLFVSLKEQFHPHKQDIGNRRAC
ncbi:MAG: hypothetical protein ACRDHW_02230 [Ktedonobacteraceae bacterium]